MRTWRRANDDDDSRLIEKNPRALYKGYINIKFAIYCVKITNRKMYASKFESSLELYWTSLCDPRM